MELKDIIVPHNKIKNIDYLVTEFKRINLPCDRI